MKPKRINALQLRDTAGVILLISTKLLRSLFVRAVCVCVCVVQVCVTSPPWGT